MIWFPPENFYFSKGEYNKNNFSVIAVFKSYKDTKLVCNFFHLSLNLDFFLCLHGHSSITAAFPSKGMQFYGSIRLVFSKTGKMLKRKQRPYKH